MVNPMIIVHILIITGLACLVLALVVLHYYVPKPRAIIQSDVYVGAVPQGYDLEHFRKTGETKLIKEAVD